MRILGIDPGYAIVGWGIVEPRGTSFAAVAYGAVTTPAGEDFSRRLLSIYRQMGNVLSRWQPEAAAMEKLFFNTNLTTAIPVAEARGVLLLALEQAGIPVAEYTPLQVKSALTGYGKAQKSQMMEMTRMLLRLKEVPKPDDTADALALALCHAQTAGNLLNQWRMESKS